MINSSKGRKFCLDGEKLKEYKLFAQRIGLVGIINLLVGLSSLVMLPILTKNLTVSDYGIWNQVLVTITLITSLGTLGLPHAIMRFFPSITKNKEIQENFYSSFFVVFFIGLILSISIFLAASPISNVLFDGNIKVTNILAAIIIVSTLNYFIINFFRSFHQVKRYSTILFVKSYLNVLFVSIMVLSGYGIIGALVGIIITELFLFIVMISLIVIKIGFKIPKFKNIKSYLSFGIPLLPGFLSYWIVESSDKYVIGIFLGSIYVGYYSPAYMIGNIVTLIVAPFAIILLPTLSKYFDEDKLDKVTLLLRYSLKYYLAATIPIFFGISFLSEPLINILSTSQIAENGYFVTPFVTLGAIFYGIYVILMNTLLLERKTKITGIIWSLGAILNLILSILLVTTIGIIGAAIATLAAYSSTLFISLLSIENSRKYFDFNFISKSIIASLIMSLFIFFRSSNDFLNLIITSLISFLIYAVVIIISKGIKKEELKFFRKILSS